MCFDLRTYKISMKLIRIRSILLLFAIIAPLCLPFTSCKRNKVYKIGVSQCSRDDWRNKMNEEIEREILIHPEAKVEIRSADDKNEKQIEDIRYFFENGFDIIIVAPNEADAITPAITEVYEKGMPVLVFDRSVNGDNFTAFQGADNVVIGNMAAKYASNLLKGKGKILELKGLKGSTPAVGRHSGFADELEKYPEINLISSAFGNWNYDDAYRAADSILSAHKDIDLIYAHNDKMAIAASNVAHKLGLHPYIIGVDAAPEIGIKAVQDGVIDATFLYPTEGYRLIRTALSILKDEPYERETRLKSASTVDSTNADILLIQNESLKEETIKMKSLKREVDNYWQKQSVQSTILYICIGLVILFCIVIFIVLKAYWQRRRYQEILMRKKELLAEQHEKQKALNEQLNVATQSKLAFFTNVSHDLRTPITLISEPVTQLLKSDNLTGPQRRLMQLADKNVRILRRLINQILDFRTYENGKLNICLSEVDFASLAQDWIESFRSVAKKRGIKLTSDIPEDQNFKVSIDPEKIERVCYNLLSNALRYTPANGSVKFACSCDGTTLRFSVSDTGVGISEEDAKQIFDCFFRVDKVRPKGSGIGLSLVKAFVELHGGTISLESELGKGSTFTVEIPVKHCESMMNSESRVTPEKISSEDIEAELGMIDETAIELADGRQLVLAIDDNEDILILLRTILGGEYNVITAKDAKKGLKLAARYTPDVILCDVMMPDMDGMECCRQLKNEVSTSHIPILMLTACSADEQRAAGYESGADGYMSKPFDATVLRARISSMIANREKIRELWGGTRKAGGEGDLNKPIENDENNRHKPGKVLENEFYSKFVALVEKEMGNADLNVDQLASEMGLGRSQFYRKIKALTNYSPVELLRNMRLKRARHLLTTTDKSISEIGYEVGFSTPAYFSKCYREAYGETPSELRSKLGM